MIGFITLYYDHWSRNPDLGRGNVTLLEILCSASSLSLRGTYPRHLIHLTLAGVWTLRSSLPASPQSWKGAVICGESGP